MKTLELKQMEVLEGGRDCARAEGAIAGAVSTGWILGPIGYSLAIAISVAYWTTQCGSSDY